MKWKKKMEQSLKQKDKEPEINPIIFNESYTGNIIKKTAYGCKVGQFYIISKITLKHL